jgi:hypothetical protein
MRRASLALLTLVGTLTYSTSASAHHFGFHCCGHKYQPVVVAPAAPARFGGVTTFGAVPGFGGVTTFGSVPTFGGITTFGSVPTFGGVTTFGAIPNGGVTTFGAIPTGGITTFGGVDQFGGIVPSGFNNQPAANQPANANAALIEINRKLDAILINQNTNTAAILTTLSEQHKATTKKLDDALSLLSQINANNPKK